MNGLNVLLVRHVHGGQDYWCLPGGKVEANELPVVAAKRELEEETGLSASKLRLLNILRYSDNDIHHTFLVETFSGEPRLGHDPELPKNAQILRAVAWKHIDELTELELHFLIAAGALVKREAEATFGLETARLGAFVLRSQTFRK